METAGEAAEIIALAERRRPKYDEHRAWINAINRAALNLEACPWAFDGEVLRIASASSSARYTVGVGGCKCKAGQAGRPCWHRAAWRLLRKAAEMLPVPATTLIQRYFQNGYAK